MRLVPWTGILLVLLGLLVAISTAARLDPVAPASNRAARQPELELAVEWLSGSAPARAARTWRQDYRVENRGGASSGPLYWRARTPLGLASEGWLAADLAPGEALRGTLEIALGPGRSELCIDVRAFDGARARAEVDLVNNRACRRLPRRERADDSFHAVPSPEDPS